MRSVNSQVSAFQVNDLTSADVNMSSVESASIPASDVGEKAPVDFGVKAVSLKSQADGNRILQGGPLRTMSSPSISRSASSYGAQHSSLTTLPHKGGLARPVQNMPMGNKPVASTSTVTSSTYVQGTATYLVPRGPPQPNTSGPRTTLMSGRPSVALQPVSSVQTLVRTPSPIGTQSVNWSANPTMNNIRATSPGMGLPRNVAPRFAAVSGGGKPGAQHRPALDAPRPLVLHTTQARPLTLTAATQIHVSTDKSLKLPGGPVTQVMPLRPFCSPTGLVGQGQATAILQRSDGMTLQPGTVLATPVRLSSPQPPLMTQRVAVSTGAPRVVSQHFSVASSMTTTRVPSSLPSNRAGLPVTPVIPNKIAASSSSPQAALITQNRITYSNSQVLSGPANVPRIPAPGATVLSGSKPCPIGPGPLVVATGTRMPVPNHQGGKPARFGSVRPQGVAVSQPLLTATVPGNLVVHPHMVVSTGKPQLSSNHVTGVRAAPPQAGPPKVVTQPLHAPLQMTTSVGKPNVTALPAASTQLTPVISKQPEIYKLAPTTTAARSVAVLAAPSVPLAKMFAAPSGVPNNSGELEPSSQSSSVFIPRSITSPGLVCTQSSMVERTTSGPTLSTYTLPTGASYFYEAPSGYQLAPDAPLVARPLSPDLSHVTRQLTNEVPLVARPYTPGLMASSAMRFNPVMIVDQVSPAFVPVSTSVGTSTAVSESSTPISEGPSSAPLTPSKLTSSPRPSILRKRENDSNNTTCAKVAKNLTSALSSSGSASRSRTPSPQTPPTSLHLETNQTSNDNGPSSNGSTTISATSSPGPEDNADPDRPSMEMSPRKKPRKQLMNDTNESIDMVFISEERMKKEKEAARGAAEEGENKVFVVKRPPNLSLLHNYKHNWKARYNHYQRYADIKPREDRKPSVTELANQKQIVPRVNGWRIYHLSSQFDDLSDMESRVLERLSTIFKAMDSNSGNDLDKEVSRVNDLIMGNIQRSKVIVDQIQEAQTQMMKVFDHKVHVSEIISRCASKRNFKKRDKH